MSFAPAPGSLADPSGSSAPVAAVRWIEGALLGTAATSVAVICVAAIGLMMLSGRISFRRAASVILGCFIVFGASSIAAAIHALAGGAGPAEAEPAFTALSYAPPPEPPPPLPAPPANPDPYAGAAAPPR
jgi:type IV secretory pathway VirB2 component (pilin)